MRFSNQLESTVVEAAKREQTRKNEIDHDFSVSVNLKGVTMEEEKKSQFPQTGGVCWTGRRKRLYC